MVSELDDTIGTTVDTVDLTWSLRTVVILVTASSSSLPDGGGLDIAASVTYARGELGPVLFSQGPDNAHMAITSLTASERLTPVTLTPAPTLAIERSRRLGGVS